MKRRISKFLTIGAAGFVVQVVALVWLTRRLGWPYASATAAAVGLAVLHNFLWHECWTWRDRTTPASGPAGRLVRYAATIGTISMAGNLAMTAVGVELLGWNSVVSNVIAVASGSLANFLVSDRWVFRRAAVVGAAAFSHVSQRSWRPLPGP